MESLCNATLMGGDRWRCAYGGRCFLLIATISAVLMLSMVFILLRGAMSRARVLARFINKGRSPQNCIARGCVSVRPSDAILRDDELICFIVAVGEQGAALPQVPL